MLPITLSVVGPVTAANDLAVGQLVIVTVNGGGTGDTYAWSTPSAGNPFATYTADASSSHLTLFSLPTDTNHNSIKCRFGSEGAPTISCMYHSALLNADIPLTVSLTVKGPTRTSTSSVIGRMKLLRGHLDWDPGAGTSPDEFSLYDAVLKNITAGVWQTDVLTDPSFLTAGSGSWGYVQTKKRTTILNGTPQPTATGLDFPVNFDGFPYPDVFISDHYASIMWTPANGANLRGFNDSPGDDPAPSVTCTWEFKGYYSLWLFYKAVDDVAGSSAYVPIAYIPWNSLGDISLVLPNTWTQEDNGSGFAGGAATYPPLTQWPIWP